MPPVQTLLNPSYYWRFLKSRILRLWLFWNPNYRSVCLFRPGHFYSPLLDLKEMAGGNSPIPNDGKEQWENIDLNSDGQRKLFSELLSLYPTPGFPEHPKSGWRYHYQNDWFPLADAIVLSALIQSITPKKIIEVGSGFSTAVMLDTMDFIKGNCEITCIEPNPERLNQLLSKEDLQRINLRRQTVQTLPLEFFDSLEANDFLFIDSSHVAKIGSDVAFLYLRVLPRLKPGVWVHIHDIFFTSSYPAEWLREGRAWNEPILLRALLIGNQGLEVRAFNRYAAIQYPELFESAKPAIRDNAGGSFWMQRI
jgi:predicted O-methyltransferase YrrM